jgi:DNA-binding Xre family transcriptional regulator
MPKDFDPTRLVDEWPLPGLSAVVRQKIKAQLLKAHADYLRTPIDPYGFIEPMQRAFGDVAGVLLEAKLLTVGLLRNQLRLFVVEAAIAGGWYAVAREEPLAELFLEYWGHPSAWEDFNGRLRNVFSAEIAEWSGKLLELEAGDSGDERLGNKVMLGAEIHGEVLASVDGTVVSIHGPGGPMTALWAQKGPRQIVLPSASIVGVSPSDKYVAWNGEGYVFRPTLESVLADDRLMLRWPSTVNCPAAARKMEQYLAAKGVGLTDFASTVGTTDRTLRRFRRTGKVRRAIFESIAKAMKTTKEDLLRS